MDPGLKGNNGSNEQQNQSSNPWSIGETSQNIGKKIELIELKPNEPFILPFDSRIPSEYLIENLPPDTISPTGAIDWALKSNNVMGVIEAPYRSNVFWLCDMRDNEEFANANTPYLLIEVIGHGGADFNGDPRAFTKGIHSGETLTFGRNHNYGRFRYDKMTSRNHFKIICDDNSEVSVVDLKSTHGTSILFTSSSKAESKENPETGSNDDPDYLETGN